MCITDRNSGSNIYTPFITKTNLTPKIGLQLLINTNESLVSVALVILSCIKMLNYRPNQLTPSSSATN